MMEEWVELCIVCFEGCKYDWNVLKFQVDFDLKYCCVQMCYIGIGVIGVVSDINIVLVEYFIFFIMVLLFKCEGLLYLYDDVEEVFFMFKGQIILMIQDGDNYIEIVLCECDLILVLSGIYCGLFNYGEEEVLMCVMFGIYKLYILIYLEDYLLVKVKCN